MSERLDHNVDYKWHRAINEFNEKRQSFESWLYLAKSAADEVPRMAMLFEMERNGKLATTHHQCSHDEQGQPVNDNHLTCCMGVECRKCPFLLAFDKLDIEPAQIDQIKAWTCATHILTSYQTQFDTSEGFILTTDDMMYWSNMYASLAGASDDKPEPDDDIEEDADV